MVHVELCFLYISKTQPTTAAGAGRSVSMYYTGSDWLIQSNYPYKVYCINYSLSYVMTEDK